MPSETSTAGTPLAPSVEKAYYRKCIALKRRLNEVEAANDEAKIRRVRLDRAIMKMRLERAFLLDELRRRMDMNLDGSEGSGDEGMATPPQDRPHRDKRRRTTQPHSTGASFDSLSRTADVDAGSVLQPEYSSRNAQDENGAYSNADPQSTAQDDPYVSQSRRQASASGRPSSRANGMDLDGAADEESHVTEEQRPARTNGSGGDSGERRARSSTSADDAKTESEQRRDAPGRSGPSGFAAVNSR